MYAVPPDVKDGDVLTAQVLLNGPFGTLSASSAENWLNSGPSVPAPTACGKVWSIQVMTGEGEHHSADGLRSQIMMKGL